MAILEPIVAEDAVLERYVRSASMWASVTPVVLPGHDDRGHLRRRIARGIDAAEQRRHIEELERRTDALLRKAIAQAGLSQELARNAALSWQQAGFLPGVAHAARYRVPRHLARFPRLHVRIQWHDASGEAIRVPGPIALGGGRFCGMGLFASQG